VVNEHLPTSLVTRANANCWYIKRFRHSRRDASRNAPGHVEKG
jgi:hypothetical protein